MASFTVDIEIDDAELISAMAGAYYPEDVFDYSVLVTWAEENGYVKEED